MAAVLLVIREFQGSWRVPLAHIAMPGKESLETPHWQPRFARELHEEPERRRHPVYNKVDDTDFYSKTRVVHPDVVRPRFQRDASPR